MHFANILTRLASKFKGVDDYIKLRYILKIFPNLDLKDKAHKRVLVEEYFV